ncbi:uncharacterized protein LOC117292945 [Asterias rubens]|uniref:uncharacterized protein LOC117292945 n=1 Tax=Asterias rubens TaxID=7604 RepID=UPI00145518D6|nr:uncharacterized protein LOC117292945 [Asterias rubens]XP_033631017.1 uncharacterized protein LOC117292945 [Asterias rubens]
MEQMTSAVTALLVLVLICIEPVAAQASGGISGVAIGLIVAGVVAVVVIVVCIIIGCMIYKRKHLGRLELEHPEFERTGEPYYKASVTNETIIPSATQARYDTTDSNASLDRTATADSDGDAVSVDDGMSSRTERREKFELELMELQPYASTFNEMSKDVQERIKNAKHGNPRVNGYKAVSRDLSRVQHLLSKRNSSGFKIPPDGAELLSWALETRTKYVELQRYKSLKDSGDSSEPPEMASIMWIQSKDDSLFEDKSSFDESAVI